MSVQSLLCLKRTNTPSPLHGSMVILHQLKGHLEWTPQDATMAMFELVTFLPLAQKVVDGLASVQALPQSLHESIESTIGLLREYVQAIHAMYSAVLRNRQVRVSRCFLKKNSDWDLGFPFNQFGGSAIDYIYVYIFIRKYVWYLTAPPPFALKMKKQMKGSTTDYTGSSGHAVVGAALPREVEGKSEDVRWVRHTGHSGTCLARI